MSETRSIGERTASCGCGQLTATAHGKPLEIYACTCLNCQRESGGAFSYSAIYPDTAVAVTGERKVWRRRGDSGRWLESEFCPTCGVTLVFRMEAWPEVVGVAAGCFADPDFSKPERVYWAHRHHRWMTFPEDIELVGS